MATRAYVRRLDATVAAMEMAADEAGASDAKPVLLLLADLEADRHVWLENGRDAIPADERAYVWPSWQMLLLLSEVARRRYPWPPGPFAAGVRRAQEEWVRRVCDDAEGKPDDYDYPVPAWQPLNEISLHQLKFASHWPGRARIEAYGTAAAEDLTALLRAVTDLPPYDEGFPLDRSGWPAAVRAAVEAELRKSGSLTPPTVPPFDWTEVPVYAPARGPWPELWGARPGRYTLPGTYVFDPPAEVMPPLVEGE
jgi:hypothetical protein